MAFSLQFLMVFYFDFYLTFLLQLISTRHKLTLYDKSFLVSEICFPLQMYLMNPALWGEMFF